MLRALSLLHAKLVYVKIILVVECVCVVLCCVESGLSQVQAAVASLVFVGGFSNTK